MFGLDLRVRAWRAGPSRGRNVRKVFILYELDLDFGFWIIGKVLILLGFGVVEAGKVFISNK